MSELERLEKLAVTQERDKAKLEGKLETLYEELGEEGFTSLSSAKSDMTILRKKIGRRKRIFQDKLNTFKKKHAHELS